MAVVTNTQLTYGTKGIREDLADVIYRITPEDTVFLSNLSKGAKPKQAFFEWQKDALASPDGANAQIEGDDVTSFDASTATTRVGNYCQISRKTLVLSDTNEEVDKAGRKSEEALQLAKRGAELKRDMETILIGASQAAVSGGTATARKTANLASWVTTNVNKAADGTNPSATTSGAPAGARVDGTQRAFTEVILKDVVQQCWTSGANISTLMVGGTQKQTVSGFAGIATKYNIVPGSKQATIIGAADFYVSDFGTISVIPNRFQRNRDAWFLDFDMLSIRYLRPFRKVALAKTGDAEKKMLIVEYGLQVNTEAAQGLAADLT